MPIAALTAAAPTIGTIASGVGTVLGGIRSLFGGGRRRRRRRAAAAAAAMAAAAPMAAAGPMAVAAPRAAAGPMAAAQQLPTVRDLAIGTANTIQPGLGTGLDIADRVTDRLGQLFNRGGNGQAVQPNPTDALQLLDLMNRRGGSRKALAEYLLFSGGLASIIRQPVVYETNDGTGRLKYGSDLGYSLVRRKNGSQELIFQIPTEIGKMLGFVKARRKPVISVRDTQAIRRAARAKDKVYKLAKDADLCVKKGTRRC